MAGFTDTKDVLRREMGAIPASPSMQLRGTKGEDLGTVSLPSGRTLADKERAEGITEPREFDFAQYSKVIDQLGGGALPTKEKAHIFEVMMKGVDDYNRSLGETKRAKIAAGPQGLQAESQARLRDIEGRIAVAKTPLEIQKIMAETAKVSAETQGLPAKTAHEGALAKYYESITANPKYRHMKDIADVYMKAYANTFDPEEKKRLEKKAIDVFSEGMSMNNKYPGAKLSQKDGKWYVPDPNRPGQWMRKKE